MCNEVIQKLAEATQSRIKTINYGRLRSKLDKAGFSEISLYAHVAMHCEENFIEPSSMGKEMLELIEGCCRDAFFVKTSNDFHFLRGHFHQLRHGNVQLSEPKSPEQKFKFLCNSCYEVLPKEARSKQQTTKNTCAKCVSAKAKANNAAKAKSVMAAVPVPKEVTEVIEPEPVKQSHPLVTVEPMQVEREPVTSIQITEVMADLETASVTLQCSPDELHVLLAAINKAKGNS